MNEEELKTIDELLEEETKASVLELSKLEPGDEKRGKGIADVKAMNDISLARKKVEQDAANREAEIANERRRLDIEEYRAVTERKKVNSDTGRAIGYIGMASLCTLAQYFLEPFFQGFKPLQKLGESLYSLSMRGR